MEDMNKILEKKMDYGNTVENDFELPNELTVRITLREYRELIASKALKQHDVDEARNDKWKVESMNRKLTEEIAKLKEKLLKLMETSDVESNEEEEDDE